MNKSQERVQKRFNNILDRIGSGPLLQTEWEILIDRLKDTGKYNDSPWGLALKRHFETNTDHRKLVRDLGSQCFDDFMTMTGIVGEDAAILLLRSFEEWCNDPEHKIVSVDMNAAGSCPYCITCYKKVSL